MKRILAISVPLTALLAVLFLSASCEKYILPKIELGTDSLFFAAAADSATVSVTANVDWKLVFKSGDASFVLITPSEGSENGEIKVRVSDAVKDEAECVVSVKSQIICKDLYIKQVKEQTLEK